MARPGLVRSGATGHGTQVAAKRMAQHCWAVLCVVMQLACEYGGIISPAGTQVAAERVGQQMLGHNVWVVTRFTLEWKHKWSWDAGSRRAHGPALQGLGPCDDAALPMSLTALPAKRWAARSCRACVPDGRGAARAVAHSDQGVGFRVRP